MGPLAIDQGGIEREARQEGHRKNDDVEREDSEDRRSRTKLGQQRIDDRSESGLSKVRDRAGGDHHENGNPRGFPR